MKTCRFITFEGGEGTGKSTQTALAAEYLRLHGKEVLHTREPGGTEGAEMIRSLLVCGDVNRWEPTSEALMMVAARIDHWHKIIEPALEKGQWVLCDRFIDSTMAYQGYGRGVNLDFLKELHKEVLPQATPGRTYMFDLDPSIGLKRALSRSTSEVRFESMDLAFHQRMREGFQHLAKENPQRCLLLDGNREPSVIHKDIIGDLSSLLKEEGKYS